MMSRALDSYNDEKFTSTKFRLYFITKIEMTINLEASTDQVYY